MITVWQWIALFAAGLVSVLTYMVILSLVDRWRRKR